MIQPLGRRPTSAVVGVDVSNDFEIGDRVIVFYFGADSVWHERLLLWPTSKDRLT